MDGSVVGMFAFCVQLALTASIALVALSRCVRGRVSSRRLAALSVLAAAIGATDYVCGTKPGPDGGNAARNGDAPPSLCPPPPVFCNPPDTAGAACPGVPAEPDVYAGSTLSALAYDSAVSISSLSNDIRFGQCVAGMSLSTNLPPPSGLRFFGVSAYADGVFLGMEWPVGAAPSDGCVGVYGHWHCSWTDFVRIADVDVSGAASNTVAILDWNAALTNAVALGAFPTNADASVSGFFRAAPGSRTTDSDGDGISDADELCVTETDPLLADTDGDGDPDGWEIERGFNPRRAEVRIPLAAAFADSLSVDFPYGLISGVAAVPSSDAPLLLGTPRTPPPSFGFPIEIPYSDWSDPFVRAYTWTVRPTADCVFSYTVAADDDVTLSVNGDQKFAYSWWGGDRGEERTYAVTNPAGETAVSVLGYENLGGPCFMTVGVAFEPYNPGIMTVPKVVEVSSKRGSNDICRAYVTGALNPFASYAVRIEREEGLLFCPAGAGGSGGGILVDTGVTADLSNAVWRCSLTNFAVAAFTLVEDGSDVASDGCIFVQRDPREPEECGCCCREGTQTDNKCVSFAQSFGRTPGRPGLPVGRAVVRADRPASALWTPHALRYDHPQMRRVVFLRNLDAVIVDGLGEVSEYRRGRPAGVSSGAGGQLYRNGAGDLVEELPDGLRVIYGPNGAASALQPEFGDPVPVSETGVTVEYAADGSVAAVSCAADGRLSAVATGAAAWRLVWTAPGGATAKTFDFGGDGTRVFTLRETRDAEHVYDTSWTYDDAAQDWVFARAPDGPNARREAKSVAWDATSGLWDIVRARLAPDGTTNSCARVRIASDGHVDRVVERSDGMSGRVLASAEVGPDGLVASETDDLGATTLRAHDAFGRVLSETVVAPGAPERTVAFAYPEPVRGYADARPVSRTESADGVELIAESFVRSPRRADRARVCGGTVRTERTHYDGRGRVTLSVAESGRATRKAYSDSGAGWTETSDEGVSDGCGFSIVPGRSTREIRTFDARGDAVRVERLVWPLGGEPPVLLSWETHVYDAGHRVVSSAYSDGTSDAAAWICTGPVWTRDRSGVVVSNTYNAAKEKATSTRYGAFGAVTTAYAYDCEGRVVAETTSAPGCATQTVTRAYDSRGRVVSETDAQGRTTTTSYSADDLVTTTVYADGGTRVETLYADGSLASVTGTAVTPEFHVYSVTNLAAEGTPPRGCRVEEVRYGSADSPRFARTFTDGFGDVVREERPGFGGATLVTENEYDSRGRLVLTRTTGEPERRYAYDDWGELTNRTESADGAWRSVSVTRANALDGEVWEVVETARTCSDAAVAPLVTSRRTRLSGLSLATNALVVAVDARGNETVTATALDPARQSSCETTAAPGVLNVAKSWRTDGVTVSNFSHSAVLTRMRFDALRRETSRLDGRGNEMLTEYDALGRVARTVDALGNATGYAYDAMGRVAAVTDALGHAVVYEYDFRGNKTYEGGATYPVCYEYDAFGNKVSMTTYRNESDVPMVGGDAIGAPHAGDTTRWLYDDATGLVTNKLHADGLGPRYEYDANGHLTKRTWARGIVTTYAYDGWGNLTNTTYSDDTPTVTLAYDALGRLVSSNGPDIAGYQYAYDDFIRCTNEAVMVGEDRLDVLRSYDDVGRCCHFEVDLTNAAYAVKSRRFDACGFVSDYGLTNSSGRGMTVSLRYDEGRISEISYVLPGGGSLSSAYMRESSRPDLVIRRDWRRGERTVYRYENEYDALGRLTNAVDSVALARAYLYNRRNELAGAQVGANAFGYAYDPIGNRTSDSFNGASKNYAANCLNQYTQVDDSQMTYDADGNLVRDDRYAYEYDAESRMLSARPVTPSEGDLAVVNAYDCKHRRVVKRVERFDGEEWRTSEAHTFAYDGSNIVLERIAFADGTTRTVEYFWGNDLSGTEQGAGGVGGLLAVSVDGAFFIPCYDHNGNVVCYVSESGTIAAQYVYDPYGNVIEQYSTIADRFAIRFSTKYTDVETGLVSYLRRFYRPDHGRWLNRDPIEERGGANLYGFCGNNCCAYIDAKGESFEDVSNFMAGVADSMTFGLTSLARKGINCSMYGEWEDPADVESSSYIAGEVTEVVVEIAVTVGGATLRHVAKTTSRVAIEGGARQAFRRANGLVGKGGYVHHVNPIKGHHTGSLARCPLPFEWAARGSWNMVWYPTRAEHVAAHEYLMVIESLDKARSMTMISRQGVNAIIQHLNSSESIKCWDGIDMSVKIDYTSGGDDSSLPVSASVFFEEYGRSE